MRPALPLAVFLVAGSFLALAVAVPLLPPAPAPGPAAPAAGGAEALPFRALQCAEPTPERPLERCNVRATARSGPANEIDLALDPRDPEHMIVVAKGYNYTRMLRGNLIGGVITPYATTFDGGKTWAEGYLQPYAPLGSTGVLSSLPWPVEPPAGDSANHESDPIVEFAADGAVLAVTLRVNNDRGLPVYRSEDGGLTFAQVGRAYPSTTDKEWMVTDPKTGNVYLATLHQSGAGFVKSTDHGLTWSAPRKVCNCVFPGIDVGPDGVIYLVGYGDQKIWFTRSLDEGATWSAPVPIADHTGLGWNPANLRLFRTPNIQQIAASRADGSVYVVWADVPKTLPATPPCVPVPPAFTCAGLPNHDVLLLRSRDGGLTWDPPRRINDDPTDAAFQFMAQVAVSPRGDVHVAWLDQRHDPTGLTAQVYYAHSADGEAWDPNLLVSDQPFAVALAHHQSFNNLAFVGDYIGLQATDDRAVVAFPDTRYGRSDVFVATIV